MPPEWMWPLDKAIIEWMDRVKEERDERYGRDKDDRHERVPMMDNELAKRRRAKGK